jgi:hypothetical protein
MTIKNGRVSGQMRIKFDQFHRRSYRNPIKDTDVYTQEDGCYRLPF